MESRYPMHFDSIAQQHFNRVAPVRLSPIPTSCTLICLFSCQNSNREGILKGLLGLRNREILIERRKGNAFRQLLQSHREL